MYRYTEYLTTGSVHVHLHLADACAEAAEFAAEISKILYFCIMRRFIEKIWTTEPKLVKLVDNPTIEQTYEIEEGYKYISILACAAGGNGGPGGYGNAGGGGGSGSLGLLKNLLLSPKTKKQISYKLGTPGTNLRLAPFTGYLNKIYVLTCGVNGDGSAAHDGGGYGGGWKPEMTGDDTYLLQNGTELLFDVSTMTGGGRN